MKTRLMPNSEKPTMIEARLVKSTWGRAVTRRSANGAAMRSSMTAQPSSTTTEAPKQPRVSALVHPQVAPSVMASSRAISPIPSPRAPRASKRAGVRRDDSGRSSNTRPRATMPSAADAQNTMCQPPPWAMSADTGRPMAAPTPRVALIAATADPTRSFGSSSRTMLIPKGIAPIAAPCKARPATIRTSELVSAHSTDPAERTPRLMTSIRLLPNISPSLPLIGTITAPASRVEVITHDALLAEVPSSRGRDWTSGRTRVCINAVTMPQKPRTAMIAPGCLTSVLLGERTLMRLL